MPYDEKLEVNEHELDCWCIGALAKADAEKIATDQVGSVEQIREKFWAGRIKREHPEMVLDGYADVDAAWQKVIKPHLDACEAAFLAHPGKDDPVSNCGNCNGTGKFLSKANPKGYWDWWVIGGRFDGRLKSLAPIDDGMGGFNYGDKFRQIGRNMEPAEALIFYLRAGIKDISLASVKEETPFVLVDGVGEWHQKGEMMMFGDWYSRVIEILKAEPEGTNVVGIDFHI